MNVMKITFGHRVRRIGIVNSKHGANVLRDAARHWGVSVLALDWSVSRVGA